MQKMHLTKEEVLGVRNGLGLTQEIFAKVIGVTRSTVVRYENGMTKPAGTAEQRIRVLKASLARPDQYEFITERLNFNGGNRVLATILELCTYAYDAAAFEENVVTLTECLKGYSGKSLLSVLGDFHKSEM